jgi:hypothetical protein
MATYLAADRMRSGSGRLAQSTSRFNGDGNPNPASGREKYRSALFKRTSYVANLIRAWNMDIIFEIIEELAATTCALAETSLREP